MFPTTPRSAGEEQRIVLYGIPWSLYVMLRDSIDSSGVRMTYLEGTLEIRSPSKTHEVSKTHGADKEVPDIAIEVVVTRGTIDKLDVYRGLGVGEVWAFEDEAFRVLTLRGDEYHPIPASAVLPEVDLGTLARFAREPDQHAALTRFRDLIRNSS